MVRLRRIIFMLTEGSSGLPVYTYACAACGQEIERRQSFSDAPLTVCDTCRGSLRRVLHSVGIVFKGSGFYNTDYRGSSKNGVVSDKSADKEEPATAPKGDAEPAAAKSDSSRAASESGGGSSTADNSASVKSSTATKDL